MERFYFGTYTRRKSKGIYQADFDTETGQLSQLQLVAQENSPTYLSLTEEHKLLSVANQDGQGGLVYLNQDYQPLSYALEAGAAPCYVTYNAKRQLVLSANYHTGQALMYRLTEQDELELLHRIVEKGSGPHPDQDHSRIHFAGLTPDGFIITCNLGTDHVSTYQLSKDLQELTAVQALQLPAGAGPRHLVFHSIFKHIFVVNELDSTVNNILYQGRGMMEHYQSVSTLPQGFQGANAASAIKATRDGKNLYVSNRGHDSIAIFQFSLDGYIHLLACVPTHGQTPRDFCLSKNEDYLIVAHQDSDNVTVFKRDLESGLLTEVSHDFQVPEAVCVINQPIHK